MIVLPHQVGVDVGVRDLVTGTEYRYGLLNPQFKSRKGPPVPVRMGQCLTNKILYSIS